MSKKIIHETKFAPVTKLPGAPSAIKSTAEIDNVDPSPLGRIKFSSNKASPVIGVLWLNKYLD